MPRPKSILDFFPVFVLTGLLLSGFLFFPSRVLARYPLLSKLIITYNLEARKRSLAEGSYRGEEGLLRITPENAQSQGMSVLSDDHYLQAKALSKRAEKAFEKAVKAMRTRRKEPSPGYHAQEIVKHFLDYKKQTESSGLKFMAYHSALTAARDERLDEVVSTQVMGKMLDASLKANEYRLRDALGHFYNACLGNHRNDPSLSPENVRFVNHVFGRFIQQAPEASLKRLDLDRDRDHSDPSAYDHWKRVMEKEGFPYVAEVEKAVDKHRNNGRKIDPLLFLALMKRESRFDPVAVSAVGAVGLTQIMPQTALDLGMKKIYKPAYFNRALQLLQDERTHRRRAMDALFKIDSKESLEPARDARALMQRSRDLGDEKHRLLSRYKRHVVREKNDERLDPARAIDYGYRYFAQMMTIQKGDISLALASYNAGPHRVRKYNGIPPYRETVHFRNQVLKYYREYLEKARSLL